MAGEWSKSFPLPRGVFFFLNYTSSRVQGVLSRLWRTTLNAAKCHEISLAVVGADAAGRCGAGGLLHA